MASTQSTVSVSKGVFVFKNGAKSASKQRRRKVSAPVFQQSDELWYQNYKSLWHNIETKLNDLNHSVFSDVLSNLVGFVRHCYDSEVLEIPTAALLMGINMPDHKAQFNTLSAILKDDVTPHVITVHSEDCQTLKGMMESVVKQLMQEEYSLLEDEDVTVKVKKRQCNVAYLQAWYEDLYPEGAHQKIVIIIPEFETFPARILHDFIQIIASYINILPFILVFGVATAISTLHQSLPYHVSNKVNVQVFNTPSSTVFLKTTLETVLFSPDCPFQLGANVFDLFTDIFLYYDFSVSGFVRNLKYALLDHCSYGNAMALCTFDDISAVLDDFTPEDYENVRHLMSFRKFVENQSEPDKQLKLLRDDKYLRKSLENQLKILEHYIKNLHLFMRCLLVLVEDLPCAPLGKQLRELYSIIVSQKITQNKKFKECFQILAHHNRSEFCRKIEAILKLLENNVNGEDIEEVIHNLKIHHAQLSVDGEREERHNFADRLSQNPIKRQDLKNKLEELTKPQSKYFKYCSKALEYLTEVFETYLIEPVTLPFHEIFFFNDKSIEKHIIGSHRAAIHTALNDPHYYFQCKCCKIEHAGRILPSMPDISIVYKLHLECGKMINLYDWLQAYVSIVDPQDLEDSSKLQVRPELQARFTQAVAELQYLGFIKSSKRKVDHVARLTWGG